MALHIFAPSAPGALRQGEIIAGFKQLQVDVAKLPEVIELVPVAHPYVIVLSQDCDLLQDFERRVDNENENMLESVLFCAATPANSDFRHGLEINRTEWKKLTENRDPRFHFLRAVANADDAKGIGLPQLAVDFKRYSALPTAEAYYWLQQSDRRCRLESPYLEHLSNRFAAYMSRVGLPLDHHVPLPGEEL
ncbi:MAG: hypothetical protein IMZ71_00990 [Chloroflexi bacterium]|nr:hypothetical protein [Chloroflexota bacterium]